MQAVIQSAEDAEEILSGLMNVNVSGVLLEEAVELYAEKEIADVKDRDEFIQQYGEETYQPIVRKAVVDVVVAVMAAHIVDDEKIFRDVIRMLDVSEEDSVVVRMKQTMLAKMADDALADMDEEGASRFRPRIEYVKTLLV